MMHAFLEKVRKPLLWNNQHLLMVSGQFEVPEWVGRLPMRVGEPAGGSLTADVYKHLIIGPGCIIVRPMSHSSSIY